jgi:hypothetical protein
MISAILPRRLLDKGDRKGNPIRDEGLGRELKVLAIKGRAWRNKKVECKQGIRIDGPRFPLSKVDPPNSANENRPTEQDKKKMPADYQLRVTSRGWSKQPVEAKRTREGIVQEKAKTGLQVNNLTKRRGRHPEVQERLIKKRPLWSMWTGAAAAKASQETFSRTNVR